MEKTQQHIKHIAPFINDIVNSFITKESFDKYFNFIQDDSIRYDIFLRHKYQLKHMLYIKFLENPELLDKIEKAIYYRKVQNKIQQKLSVLAAEVNKPLPSDRVHQMCEDSLLVPEKKMEEEGTNKNDDEIYTLLSDILQSSESVNSSIISIYKPEDPDDILY
ncbi:hypothetical protein EDI_202670 [Entamoeba dispar SAW760]|uniref:Uncharacterized protein n=1 Tax=Entamoeba dispar (strain ATCC PRA-260 / SAW760) TaxID=370354 RepID=B0ET92_ENTDS|nr:uncharacterized protein EDI_202670 [Entamoeba dispar SAW760]EDR22252.1 hypothetical protein EDI_202670 [Entamoeba dispar SAW760]|eukprot:EDR22252.1 hypothetical protein EDI_202670 [Entamoeba dispar SAW760]